MGGILGRRSLNVPFSNDNDDVFAGRDVNFAATLAKEKKDTSTFINPLRLKRDHIVDQRRHYGDSKFYFPNALDPTQNYGTQITSPFTFTNSKFEDVLNSAYQISPRKELKAARQDIAGKQKVKYYLKHDPIKARRVEPDRTQFDGITKESKIIATYNPTNNQVDFSTMYPHMKKR